ncbi:MAG: YeeE/YedE family protein, partial [Erythrobacter sp.]
SGCTSGHGVCGMSRLSQRSLVAVATFMATCFATVAAINAFGIAVLP